MKMFCVKRNKCCGDEDEDDDLSKFHFCLTKCMTGRRLHDLKHSNQFMLEIYFAHKNLSIIIIIVVVVTVSSSGKII